MDLLLELEQGEPGVGEEGFFSDEGGWQLVVDDAAKVTEMIREREQQGTPVVLLGHSMGSMVGRTIVAQYGKSARTPAEFAAVAERGAPGSVALAGFICTGASGVADVKVLVRISTLASRALIAPPLDWYSSTLLRSNLVSVMVKEP